jgi:S-adenosylmethionine:tRNA ribosyltransferase-isomerase
MKTSALDYDLPQSLIAQHPCAQRDASRLLVLNRAEGRLKGTRPTGGKVELFLLAESMPGVWEALVRPSRRIKPGTKITITDDIVATVNERLQTGYRLVSFDVPDVLSLLEGCGEIPLPPYIVREESDPSDLTRYQTIYANEPGAVAAPTAGLHFTEEAFRSLEAAGIRNTTLTLHVGYGTFKPVHAEDLEDHQVDPETFNFSETAATTLNEIRAQGGRVVAVGTTSTRVLETQYRQGQFHQGEGQTDCYIYPPYTFGGVDALLTNFHLPQSSLLALVCAFGGTDFILKAYHHAVQEKFRFYSYGDAMLIL